MSKKLYAYKEYQTLFRVHYMWAEDAYEATDIANEKEIPYSTEEYDLLDNTWDTTICEHPEIIEKSYPFLIVNPEDKEEKE